MSLYLCIFEQSEDIAGVDAGRYSDFGAFREEVCSRLENKIAGSRFPVLMTHSDCDGTWEVEQVKALLVELTEIRKSFSAMPPTDYPSAWQTDLATRSGLRATSLSESFLDVDGEPLLDRLIDLASIAVDRGLAIVFQ